MGQRSKFWPKIEIYISVNTQILFINRNLVTKPNFGLKKTNFQN